MRAGREEGEQHSVRRDGPCQGDRRVTGARAQCSDTSSVPSLSCSIPQHPAPLCRGVLTLRTMSLPPVCCSPRCCAVRQSCKWAKPLEIRVYFFCAFFQGSKCLKICNFLFLFSFGGAGGPKDHRNRSMALAEVPALAGVGCAAVPKAGLTVPRYSQPPT